MHQLLRGELADDPSAQVPQRARPKRRQRQVLQQQTVTVRTRQLLQHPRHLAHRNRRRSHTRRPIGQRVRDYLVFRVRALRPFGTDPADHSRISPTRDRRNPPRSPGSRRIRHRPPSKRIRRRQRRNTLRPPHNRQQRPDHLSEFSLSKLEKRARPITQRRRELLQQGEQASTLTRGSRNDGRGRRRSHVDH